MATWREFGDSTGGQPSAGITSEPAGHDFGSLTILTLGQPMGYRLLADLVVAVHFAYVTFVVAGQLLILIGILRRWRWVRNFWFRVAHLTAIVIVAAEALCSLPCPLTVWEQSLRTLGGTPSGGGTFIGNLLHDLLFYQAPEWVFTTVYVVFALLVLATFVLAPPRRARALT